MSMNELGKLPGTGRTPSSFWSSHEKPKEVMSILKDYLTTDPPR